jgi:hypothetical protein
MPTTIHFTGAEQPLTVEEDYDTVTSHLIGTDPSQQFTRAGDSPSRVRVFKAAIAYVEETEPAEEKEPAEPGRRLGRVVP